MGTGCLCFYAPRRSVAPVNTAEDPPHQNLVYLRNVAKRHPHAVRTWQVPRYPLGLPYRELLQGANFVAPRARYAPRWAVRAPPHAQGRGHPFDGEGQALALRKRGPFFTVARGPVPRERWSARTMARDRLALREREAFFSFRQASGPSL